MKEPPQSSCSIPLRYVGPLLINGPSNSYEVTVPLATYETPLWPSVSRGARVTKKAGGITAVVTHDAMARSIAIEAENAKQAAQCVEKLSQQRKQLFSIAESTSHHLQCEELSFRQVGSCIYIRLTGRTGDASGHNMITKGADAMLQWICTTYPELRHISVSGNYCTDKKVSSVNAILGRGKSVVADVLLSNELCRTELRTTPEALSELNTKKNLLGSIINGGVQTANAHFANMLLALYLPTGQDAANIVEGSQGITFAEVRGTDLYFSVSLPNIIVGTIGHGKDLPGPAKALEHLGCGAENSGRLAEIVAATVLCGELSLLAAQTKPGELVRTHISLERGG